VRKALLALAITAATAAVGLVGAWAFNPDSGALLHSELLWRLFGVPAELALLATWALVALLVLRLVSRPIAAGIRATRRA
jgi:hypothetical protein